MAQSSDSVKLRRELSQVPITGLALYNANDGTLYVLAGEDADLVIYVASSGRTVCRVSAFVDQPVHGIHIQRDDARGLGNGVIWGSSSVAFFTIDEVAVESGTPPVLTRMTAHDWIYGAAVSPFDSSRAVLVTAHNEAVLVNQDALTGKATPGEMVSPSRPMLYTAHLTWLSAECVLVAGGTVFGDVLVWKYHIGDGDSPGFYEMLFVLSGHEGSIFGVDLSPAMTLQDGSTARFVASCSDDRTIRIWDITERDTKSATARPQNDTGKALETGFRVTPSYDDMLPSQDAIAPVAVVMGHASRIWSVKFALPSGASTLDGTAIAVYSFGEDSTVQRWHLDLDVTLPSKETVVTGKMSHSQTFSVHNGKNLWASAALSYQNKTLIASGGADGRICLIEEPPKAQRAEAGSSAASSIGLVTVDVGAIPKPLSSGSQLEKGSELFSRFDFLGEDQLLVSSTHGRLLLRSANDGAEWKEIQTEEDVGKDLKLCYVLKAVADGVAILGTTSGNIYYFSVANGLTCLTTLPGRVSEICCLSGPTQPENSGCLIKVLIYLHGASNGHYIAIDRSTATIKIREDLAGLDARFLPVSAAQVGDLLILGSRRGWLSTLSRKDDVYRPMLYLATRTQDAISAIVPLPSKPGSLPKNPLYILVTSRDGMYRIYEIARKGDEFGLELLHETSPPLGPMIEGAWFTSGPVPELILYGFRSKNFIIWNETSREELAAVDCGGAHRTFRLIRSAAEPSRFRFAFTRTSILSIFSQNGEPHQRIKTGGHGREVRALSYNGRYIATGAEDTSIRIWQYQQAKGGGPPEMRYLTSMKAHVAGLQKLQWLGQDYLFSSGGNEEFFAWRVRQLDAAYEGPAVMCEGVFADKSADGDLRVMDFDVSRAEDGGAGSAIVTLGFSNSALKTYRYTSGGGFELVAKGSYTGACLTQVRHLDVGDSGSRVCVLTASTDGHLALWRTDMRGEDKTRAYVLEHTMQLHQNSIKSLDMVEVKDGYQILTGGDDNALGTAKLRRASSNETNGTGCCHYRFSARSLAESAHAAAINGVALLKDSSNDDEPTEDEDQLLLGVSVSNDQRVKTWRMQTSPTGKCAALLGNAYSGVADAGDVAVVGEGRSQRVVVAGVGVEVWKLWGGEQRERDEGEMREEGAKHRAFLGGGDKNHVTAT